MTWAARRILWPLAGIAALLAMVLLRDSLLGVDRTGPILGASIAALGLAALAALLAYRVTADTRLLFVAVGAAGVAINLFVFDLAWSQGSGAGRTFAQNKLGAPTVALLSAWLLFGVSMVFAVPWWERRGRPALNPFLIGAAGLGSLALVDLVVFLVPPSVSSRTAFGRSILVPGWLDTVLAWTVAGVLVVASARLMMHVVRSGSSGSGWLSSAAAVAVGAPASWLLLRLDSIEVYRASQALYLGVPAVVGTIVVIASLVSARSTMSLMRRASDRATEIVEGRAEIASMIAHEVRGPVTTIRGIAATAATHYERLDDAERREFFDLIEQESRRLLSAVDQTSLALKVDARTLTYVMAPTDLAAAVRKGVDDAAVQTHPVHVVAEEGVSLLADAARLTLVVAQLVDNASKFSPAGSPITVRAVSNGTDALIEIDDRGPGIPSDRREAVFELFGQWRPKGYEEQPGNGLGLFISRALAAEHHGDISVEDGPAGGTMLRVRLPLGGN